MTTCFDTYNITACVAPYREHLDNLSSFIVQNGVELRRSLFHVYYYKSMKKKRNSRQRSVLSSDFTLRETAVAVRLPASATKDNGFLSRTIGAQQMVSCTVERPVSLLVHLVPAAAPSALRGQSSPCHPTSSGAANTHVRRTGRPPDPHSVHKSGSASATKASRPSIEGQARSKAVTVNASLRDRAALERWRYESRKATGVSRESRRLEGKEGGY